jgi:hypothetical protein
VRCRRRCLQHDMRLNASPTGLGAGQGAMLPCICGVQKAQSGGPRCLWHPVALASSGITMISNLGPLFLLAGFVYSVADDAEELMKGLGVERYETKTMGTREQPAARIAGEGVRLEPHPDNTVKSTAWACLKSWQTVQMPL